MGRETSEIPFGENPVGVSFEEPHVVELCEKEKVGGAMEGVSEIILKGGWGERIVVVVAVIRQKKGFDMFNPIRTPNGSISIQRRIDRRRKFRVCSMLTRHVRPRSSFARLFIRLFTTEKVKGLQHISHMTRKSRIHFQLPIMIEFGIKMRK